VQFHPDVTTAMMHRWTTRGCERLDAPGARRREDHFAFRAIYDRAERVWLDAFLRLWLRQDEVRPGATADIGALVAAE
jgi:GMP synthase (glutamine-hydrolysing)